MINVRRHIDDNMHRITAKKQHITQKNVQFDGTLNAGYDLTYAYSNEAGKKFQLANVGDANYRTEAAAADAKRRNNSHAYQYDKNGNLIYVNTALTKLDSTVQTKTNERMLRWDEENRLLAVNDNGFVSQYWYDAAGERTVKTSGDGEAIYVNSLFSGGRTGTQKFTAYISPYLVVSQAGAYTKHIYIGSQRIVSKLGDLASYGADPRRIEYAGANIDGTAKPNYPAKYTAQQQSIKNNYNAFEVPYNGKDNDDYVNGQGFCCTDNAKSPAMRAARANDNPEKLQFYYSSDHLGSSSVITDLDGNVSQHIEYVPFGEVFIEERNNVWNTPYLFNGKELDEETGLYYYGARYYNPRTSLWISSDPLAEKNHSSSSYVYCINSPVKYVDPLGLDTLVFNNANKYIDRIKSDGVHVGKKIGKDGFIFSFADPINDPNNIGNEPGKINMLFILDDETMLKDLDRAGVNKSENRGPIDGLLYMKNHSHSGTNSGELDFVVNSEIFGSKTFGDEKMGNGLPSSYLYITKVGKQKIGHNNYNFGNFLWGASAKALKVSLFHAQIGAHVNNFFNDPENQGKPWSRRKFDSRDDQYSITMGYLWRTLIKNKK